MKNPVPITLSFVTILHNDLNVLYKSKFTFVDELFSSDDFI